MANGFKKINKSSFGNSQDVIAIHLQLEHKEYISENTLEIRLKYCIWEELRPHP